MLTDDAPNPAQMPTKANLERGMQWLVAGAQPNDSLFFHCELLSRRCKKDRKFICC